CGFFRRLILLKKNRDIQNHIVHTLTRCNLRSVSVHNVAPFVGDCPAVIILLIQDYLRITAPPCHVDYRDSSYKNNKNQYHCHKQHYQFSLHPDWKFPCQKFKSAFFSFSSSHISNPYSDTLPDPGST